jgi:hypothetical protein
VGQNFLISYIYEFYLVEIIAEIPEVIEVKFVLFLYFLVQVVLDETLSFNSIIAVLIFRNFTYRKTSDRAV